MKIVKKFKFEGSHVVRNASSFRCSHSVHGHSYVVDIEFEGSNLDNAQMLFDFGLMKSTIGSFIDSLDHCHIICSGDTDEYRQFFKKNNDRWIEVWFNPSAEMLSVWILYMVQKILDHTEFMNGEGQFICSAVTVHETVTGEATASPEDVKNLWKPKRDIEYSSGVKQDWSDELKEILLYHSDTINPKITRQIELR